MKITLAQMNTVVGDIDGNLSRVLAHLDVARDAGADLIVFHEMCLTGYPPLDLVERGAFVAAAGRALETLVHKSSGYPGLGIIVGLPVVSEPKGGKGIANAAALVCDGEVKRVQEKSLLPTYDVFDEMRYFDRTERIEPVPFKDEVLGISICEDAWNDPDLFDKPAYDIDPIAVLAQKGATILVNVSASPFTVGKDAFRFKLAQSHARRHGLPFVMVNQVGGNDELVFDGRSMYVGADAEAYAFLPLFEEGTVTVDTESPGEAVAYPEKEEIGAVHDALVMGTRDYLRKCGFERAVIGLSGGIDSAVVLAIAAQALGPENVIAVAMPSPYSSAGSRDDAERVAANLGVDLHMIDIGDVMLSYDAALASAFQGLEADVTEENIQARIRGNLLMAYSNKFGHIVLSTGNKSELAVGYCTLYGDMSGGLAVISDLPKTWVYRLAHWFNRDGELIPETIVEKAPSAELKPDQKDSDSLPQYETLDAILDLYVEEAQSREGIVAAGHDPETVDWVLAAVRRNEYKRKQAAPGLKVTSKAFGVGRRFPIAARYDV
jgi:NAD+ synthase (glutamine-hydrolysing)